MSSNSAIKYNMEFEGHFRKANRFQVSDSHVNLERVKVSDSLSCEVKSTNNANPYTVDLVENMVCWICDQPISPRTSLRETHFLEHYEYIFDDILPRSAPFECPECHKSHGGKMMLMRHYAFTHEKIYQMTELTPDQFGLSCNQLNQITTETITPENGESSKDVQESSGGLDESSKDVQESSGGLDEEAVYLCPFRDCDSEFTFEDLKYGSASRHMLSGHCLLPCHLKTGQYKFAKKEVPPCDGETSYVCPIEGCRSEFTFNDLKFGRAAKHMRSFHFLTPADLRDAGFVFVRKEVIVISEDTDEEQSFEDVDMTDEEPPRIKWDLEDKTVTDEELSDEDESYEESCDSGIASNNTSISVNPKLAPLNDWLRSFTSQGAISSRL